MPRSEPEQARRDDAQRIAEGIARYLRSLRRDDNPVTVEHHPTGSYIGCVSQHGVAVSIHVKVTE